MINTKIVEARVVDGKIEETDLGWCSLPEVPVEKRAPSVDAQGHSQVLPLAIKVNDINFWIIGHSWELQLSSPEAPRPMADSYSTLILVVQRVPEPSSLIKADASALDKLGILNPPPGSSQN